MDAMKVNAYFECIASFSCHIINNMTGTPHHICSRILTFDSGLYGVIALGVTLYQHSWLKGYCAYQALPAS